MRSKWRQRKTSESSHDLLEMKFISDNKVGAPFSAGFAKRTVIGLLGDRNISLTNSF